MMESGGKSSFNLGLDSKIARCLLMMRPTPGKFGLNVVTNRNNFFLRSGTSPKWSLRKSLVT